MNRVKKKFKKKHDSQKKKIGVLSFKVISPQHILGALKSVKPTRCNGSFQNHHNSFNDYRYMLLPQTF